MSENETDLRDLFAVACVIGMWSNGKSPAMNENMPRVAYQFANKMITERRKWVNSGSKKEMR